MEYLLFVSQYTKNSEACYKELLNKHFSCETCSTIWEKSYKNNTMRVSILKFVDGDDINIKIGNITPWNRRWRIQVNNKVWDTSW